MVSKATSVKVKLWDDPASIEKWIGLFNQLMKDLGGVSASYTVQLKG